MKLFIYFSIAAISCVYFVEAETDIVGIILAPADNPGCGDLTEGNPANPLYRYIPCSMAVLFYLLITLSCKLLDIGAFSATLFDCIFDTFIPPGFGDVFDLVFQGLYNGFTIKKVVKR